VSGWDDVRRIAMSLPGSEERLSRERLQWRVGGKLFVWERPLREKEVLELGEDAPGGPVMGARVEHLIAKEALLAAEPTLFFTTSHFKGSAAVLVRLEEIGAADLEEVVTEAWFARAPPKLAAAEAQRLQKLD
jgi:hypothetical protein